MLHLNSGVHFDEHMLSRAGTRGVQQELHRSRIDIANGLRKCHGIAVHCLANGFVQVGRGRNIDNLLVATLHAAIALEKVHGVAHAVGQNLNFDVTRTQDCLLDKHSTIAKGALGLAHGGLQSRAQVLALFHAAHSAATATRHGLGEHREANGVRKGDQSIEVSGCLRRL